MRYFAVAVGIVLAAALIWVVFFSGYILKKKLNSPSPSLQKRGDLVVLETNHGTIKIQLDTEGAPQTAANFAKLTAQGFYDGVTFHRVIDGFMIQGGDPAGNGTGGPGYVIPDEFAANNRNDRGTISMANAGPNTGGSQFFINLANNNFLDSKHPVFGKVVSGMDVVDRIGKVPTEQPGILDRPVDRVIIIKAYIE